MEKLTDREVDVMMAIWNSDVQPVPTGDILRYINRNGQNSLQTLQVVLRRLCEKGVIHCDKSRQTNLYTATIREDDYLKFTTNNFLLHHYPRTPPARVAIRLLAGEELTENDKQTLREIINAQNGRGEMAANQ